MVIMDARPSLDYDNRVEGYAAHRHVNPAVLRVLLASGLLGPDTCALDVGCGTGNYAAALTAATGCRISGIDPSARMLDRAREAAPWAALVQGSAESLPFPDESFDIVMSTDVIHHVQDRSAFFREAARALRPGGRIVTVTDSYHDIPRRQPLSNYFPETVAVELRRYPPVPLLRDEMAKAGLTNTETLEVQHPYDLTDIEPYREKAFSSLLIIPDDALQRGIARLEAALAAGPIPCVSRYTLIWGELPSGDSPPVSS